jgi:anoctamin-10
MIDFSFVYFIQGNNIMHAFGSAEEKQRKWLLDHWALDWMGLTSQPIDAIYSYFGAKVT